MVPQNTTSEQPAAWKSTWVETEIATDTFDAALRQLSAIIDEYRFTFTPTGFTTHGIDSSQTQLMRVNIPERIFKQYDLKTQGSIGVNTEQAADVLDVLSGDGMELCVEHGKLQFDGETVFAGLHCSDPESIRATPTLPAYYPQAVARVSTLYRFKSWLQDNRTAEHIVVTATQNGISIDALAGKSGYSTSFDDPQPEPFLIDPEKASVREYGINGDSEPIFSIGEELSEETATFHSDEGVAAQAAYSMDSMYNAFRKLLKSQSRCNFYLQFAHERPIRIDHTFGLPVNKDNVGWHGVQNATYMLSPRTT